MLGRALRRVMVVDTERVAVAARFTPDPGSVTAQLPRNRGVAESGVVPLGEGVSFLEAKLCLRPRCCASELNPPPPKPDAEAGPTMETDKPSEQTTIERK